MRPLALMLFGLVVVALIEPGTMGTAQDKKGVTKKGAEKKVPAKVVEQLQPWINRLKESTEPEVKEQGGGFVRTRNVAAEVTKVVQESDFADKPYVAHVRWVSNRQDSKIYAEKDKASEAKDWLPPGQVAGQEKLKTVPSRFDATLTYDGSQWTLEKLEWRADLTGVTGKAPNPTRSTANGDSHPWWDTLRGVKPK